MIDRPEERHSATDIHVLSAATESIKELQRRLQGPYLRCRSHQKQISDAKERAQYGVMILSGLLGLVGALVDAAARRQGALPDVGPNGWFLSAFGGLMSAEFLGNRLAAVLPSSKKAQRGIAEARVELVAAIRSAEATMDRGWLVRFSCFATDTSPDSFIRSFDVAADFDPMDYMEAVDALHETLEESLQIAKGHEAEDFALGTWRTGGDRAHG
ncbi:hypothetical protein E4T66_18190 [Sinimarinibacterium sp. CAU 1509]|uniref:hypothetical protein n=1 Tax=Sinimarinibacterium sp. CAU 1509 TaxID=2562283 RepID=UPI0010ABE11C|nr:hypothetical protein [Sinimarinibacterium sp. CAU 1509]TJY57336.1 hypothetical protein E4T66_18190 [Sinimarinibacterium sp. CAU 1509]